MRRSKALVWSGVFAVCLCATSLSCSGPAAHEVPSVAGAAAGQTSDRPPAGTQSSSTRPKQVYRSPLAGAWYEADAQSLRQELRGYLQKAEVQPVDSLCALIVPHAGYRWSGQTAAYAYKLLQGRHYKRVVVLGPSHRVPMENVASVPDYTHYETPLGQVPLDREFIDYLLRFPEFQSVPYAHDGEHSVQIQLPWLQTVLKEFRFVPIVVGQLDRPTMRRIANILHGVVDRDTLVVASSDFTHYGPNYGYTPFRKDVPENLKKLDMGAWERIQRKDFDGFFDYIAETGTTICGRYAIGVLLSMLPKNASARLLHYDTSGHVGGDYTNSVSYLAVAFGGQWPAETSPLEAEQRVQFSDKDKQLLLRLARETLVWTLKNKRVPLPSDLDLEITSPMKTIAGVFVTLKKHGELRGCIGEIFPTRPLYKAVIAEAVNAGLADPRFPPVTLSELDELTIEISVLTPPKRVDSWKDIIIGRHGIVLRKDGKGAVFLPQVAIEQGWDLETTLTHLARKAGLPGDAWRQGASFQVFEAVVFGEKEPPKKAAKSAS